MEVYSAMETTLLVASRAVKVKDQKTPAVPPVIKP